jgi:protein-S-isoprenylcysteine O-methyltransferase Ste14
MSLRQLSIWRKLMTKKIYNLIPDATLAGSILLGYFLDITLPITEIIPSPVNLIGWVVIASGLGFSVCTLAILKSKHTSSDPGGLPSALITTGPFSFSRNPLYLGYVITTSGAAVIFGSLTAFIAPVICFSVIHLIIIPAEEKNLQKIFGIKYEHYKSSVRRWI